MADESSKYISMMKQIIELNLQSQYCIILHILPLSDPYLAKNVLIVCFHRDCKFSRYAYNFLTRMNLPAVYLILSTGWVE